MTAIILRKKLGKNKIKRKRRKLKIFSGYDIRQQLCNDGDCGPIERIQLSRERIHSLHGMMFDIDPKLFHSGAILGAVPRNDPDKFFRRVLKPLLRRHPVLRRAKVVNSGTGLHVLLMFDEPLVLTSDSDRDHAEAVVEMLLPLLPIDPDQPGITATTRKMGSINSKNGSRVELLHEGEPIEFAELVQAAEQIHRSPFASIAGVLLGDPSAARCPICNGADSRLAALDHQGRCYGSCGTVTLEGLWDRIYCTRSDQRKLSRGATLAKRFKKACSRFSSFAVPGRQSRHILRGIATNGNVAGDYDAKLAEMTQLLITDGRTFAFGDDVVMERGEGVDRRLVTLASADKAERSTGAFLAGIMVCEIPGKSDAEPAKQFPVPDKLVESLMMREATRQALPQLKAYYRRPIVDERFIVLGPGWHPHVGILVHGTPVEPAELGPVPDTSLPVMERLPSRLRDLLKDFCFREPADCVNAVAALLTTVLAPHFVSDGKPIFLIDGNQPSVGKSLLASLISGLAEGTAHPASIAFTPDTTELEKRIVASIKDLSRSVLVIDNAKTSAGRKIDCAALESMTAAPQVGGRDLGLSVMISRRNAFVWILTMNHTRASEDLVARGCPIRLYYEGDPHQRELAHKSLLKWVHQNHAELLSELFGMVYRWSQAGRPPGERHHRFAHWAQVVGGILLANGLPEFLDNAAEAAIEFDASRDELTALAEAALNRHRGPAIRCRPGQAPSRQRIEKRGLAARDWIELFDKAGIEQERLQGSRSEQSKATIVGHFLSAHVGQSVTLQRGAEMIIATLCRAEGRSNRGVYYFDIHSPDDESRGATAKKKKRIRKSTKRLRLRLSRGRKS